MPELETIEPQIPWYISISGFLILASQLACLVHLLRSGRPYYWFWVIMWFPVLGALAYLFFEVRPRGLKLNWKDLRWRMMGPAKRIETLRAAFEDSPTLKNRYRLAEELTADQQHEAACTLLIEGARGPFADDMDLLLRVAESQLECGRVADAAATLHRMVPSKAPDIQQRQRLVQARTLAGEGKLEAAEQLFKELAASRRNEAGAFYYGEMLLQAGRKDEAEQQLRGILQRYRRGTSVWRFQEKRWYVAAKRSLKAA